MIQIVAVAGLTGWLSWWNGQQAVNRLAFKLQDEISDRIQLRLDKYLEAPKIVARINADEVRWGHLKLQDSSELEHYLFNQLKQFNSVSGILVGTAQGQFRAVNRRGNYRLLKSDPGDRGLVYDYSLDDNGQQQQLLRVLKKPNVKNMPWYMSAATAGGFSWGKIFQTHDNEDLSLNANYPIYNPQTGDLLGVASCGVVLSVVDHFLDSLKVSPTGLVFIIQRDGLLVGTSTNQLPYTTEKQNGKVRLTQVNVTESSHPLIRSTAEQLSARFGGFTNITHDQQLTLMSRGEREFVKVVPFRDELGLDWLIVVVVPEADFMEQITANTRTTIWLCVVAVIVALALGAIASNWMVKPMLRLSRASHAMAAGDLAQRIPEEIPIREMQVTAQAFNQMAQKLSLSFEQIEAANANLEAQVNDRTAQLQLAVEELERLNRLKDDFLSTVSHELRTPMSNIKMAIQMLEINLNRLGVLDSENSSVQRYFQILKAEGQREINLINDLLDLSRLDSGKKPPTLTTVDPTTWLPHVVKPYVERASYQQQQLCLDVPDYLPSLVTDLSELERILGELLNNACKYTPAGETIIVSARVVGRGRWSDFDRETNGTASANGTASNGTASNGTASNGTASHTDERPLGSRSFVHKLQALALAPQTPSLPSLSFPTALMLSVCNTGVEIPPTECDRIFDKFYRIPSNDPWKHGGTGLGLALVKGLVEHLDGTIHVESGAGQTTFVVQLPLSPQGQSE